MALPTDGLLVIIVGYPTPLSERDKSMRMKSLTYAAMLAASSLIEVPYMATAKDLLVVDR